MRKNILSLLLILFSISCMEPTKEIDKQAQIAISMVLNANPMDTIPELIKYRYGSDWYQNEEWNSGIDIAYIVNQVIDKDDSIYVVDDSLNTMIPADITVSNDNVDYSFKTSKIYQDSITICYFYEYFHTYYYQFLPYIRDKEWQIKAGSKYSVIVKTKDGNIYTGSTQVPGEFHFLPWEDGKYLKRVDQNHWKIRWSPSCNGFEYSFRIWGFSDDFSPGRYTDTRTFTNDFEASFELYFCDRQSTSDTPGVDAPYPNKFFAQVYVFDENLYRYKYLLQEPAGWTNCLGILGSTNLATIVFEQDLE